MKKYLSGFIMILIVACILLTGCGTKSIVKDLSIDALERKIKEGDDFIVAVIQTGCSACQAYEPIYHSVMTEYELDAYTINLTNLSDEDTKKLDNISYVSGTPTTLFFIDGKLESSYNKLVGKISSENLKNRLSYLEYIEEE